MNAEDDAAADQVFEQRARDELRRGSAAVTPEIRVQLDRIVEHALNQPRPFRALRFTLPAGVAAVLAALVFMAHPWRATEVQAIPAADDFALLIDGDNLDLLEQMEFYRWLDRQPGILDEAAAAASPQRS